LGRPRKNRNLLEMSGTIRDHPGRYAEESPEPATAGPIGELPEEFKTGSDALKLTEIWNRIVSTAPIGLLTVSDREFVITLCSVGVDAKRVGTKGQARAREAYAKMLKSIGMTPEGRAIRGIGGKAPTKTANPLETFTRKRRRAI
jgi:hypothetical protein